MISHILLIFLSFFKLRCVADFFLVYYRPDKTPSPSLPSPTLLPLSPPSLPILQIFPHLLCLYISSSRSFEGYLADYLTTGLITSPPLQPSYPSLPPILLSLSFYKVLSLVYHIFAIKKVCSSAHLWKQNISNIAKYR